MLIILLPIINYPWWVHVGIPCLKPSILGIAHLIYSPYLCTQNQTNISEESVAKARKVNVHLLGHQVFVCQGSAEKLPYEDSKFDLVTAVETVYFWPNLPGCLQEVSRVLKQGGKFAILLEVVDGDSMWTNVVEGMKVYSPVELQAMLLEAGFIETEIHHKRPSYATIIGVKP